MQTAETMHVNQQTKLNVLLVMREGFSPNIWITAQVIQIQQNYLKSTYIVAVEGVIWITTNAQNVLYVVFTVDICCVFSCLYLSCASSDI